MTDTWEAGQDGAEPEDWISHDVDDGADDGHTIDDGHTFDDGHTLGDGGGVHGDIYWWTT